MSRNTQSYLCCCMRIPSHTSGHPERDESFLLGIEDTDNWKIY
jgi:hypothetical protein